MTFVPYLTFSGNGAEALEFYASVFDGEVTEKMLFKDSPEADQFPDLANHLMHGVVRVGDKVLMGSDHGPSHYQKPQGMSVQMGFDTVEKARAAFDQLAEGGQITMPFGPTFWSAGFGLLTDRFGTPWVLNCDLEPTQD